MPTNIKASFPTTMTPAIRWKVVKNLLSEESLAKGKSLMAREIVVLKNLEGQGYNSPEFWLNLNLGFKLRSILWLQNSGRVELNKLWGMFLLEQKQKKELDEKKKADNLSAIKQISSLSGIPKARERVALPKKKESILDMIDYEEKEL